jgi:RNA polymerase sigma-70 factor (ECF subfamily)
MASAHESELSARARLGDRQALSELFQAYHAPLVRMVALRLDADLARRIDPADVVQDAWIEVLRRVEEWRTREELPFRVWLRLTTRKALIEAARLHRRSGNLGREFEARADMNSTNVSAFSMAEAIVARIGSPTQNVQREELRMRVLEAVEALDPVDREIVALRNFEDLSNADVAAELAIEPAAASMRYSRALFRLRPHLESLMPMSERRGE